MFTEEIIRNKAWEYNAKVFEEMKDFMKSVANGRWTREQNSEWNEDGDTDWYYNFEFLRAEVEKIHAKMKLADVLNELVNAGEADAVSYMMKEGKL